MALLNKIFEVNGRKVQPDDKEFGYCTDCCFISTEGCTCPSPADMPEGMPDCCIDDVIFKDVTNA